MANVFNNVNADTSHLIIAKLYNTYINCNSPKAEPTASQNNHADAEIDAAIKVSNIGHEKKSMMRMGR